MATFNIGQQNAANVQNIGGDAVVEGGIHASATWETVELRHTIARAQGAVADLGLPPPTLESVNESLTAAAQEAAEPRPDRYHVAEHLGTAARTLDEAGALVGAGTRVLEALRRAAELLGPVGIAAIGAL
jgi:propanediol dehydratase large subunit